MLTFWLKLGTHPPFKRRRQAHSTLHRLLRGAGVNLSAQDLSVAVEGDDINGAFTELDLFSPHRLADPELSARERKQR